MTRKPAATARCQAAAPVRIEKLEKPIVRFLSDFCAIDTSNPPGRNYLACCEFLRDKLESLGLAVKIHRVPKAQQAELVPGLDDWPRYNLVARWDVGAKRTLHFTGHYDVVPATSNWRTDPFSPVVKGGRLYARGSSDMKGPNTCAIFAVEAMMRAGVTPPWNIELSFTADEETGGHAGLGWLVHQRKIRPDAAVLCEGGGGGNLGYAHRGVVWTNVTVHGKAGHAANPRNGVNALDRARHVIDELRKLEKDYADRISRHVAGKRAARRPTMMIGGVAATGPGDKVNTIPDRFTFSIDRRVIPEERLAGVRREIRDAVKRAQQRDGNLRIDVDFFMHVEPGASDTSHPVFAVTREQVRRVRGKRPLLRMSGGFNDMHYLTNDAHVPTVGYGCAGGSGAHGDNECIPIKELLRTTRVYAGVAMGMPTK